MTVLACIGHWYTSLIYAGPVLLMAGGLGFVSMREKLRKRRAGRGESSRVRRSSVA